jgi:hypothetical protein
MKMLTCNFETRCLIHHLGDKVLRTMWKDLGADEAAFRDNVRDMLVEQKDSFANDAVQMALKRVEWTEVVEHAKYLALN